MVAESGIGIAVIVLATVGINKYPSTGLPSGVWCILWPKCAMCDGVRKCLGQDIVLLLPCVRQ